VSVGIIGEKSFFGEDDALFQRSRKFSATARYIHTSISNSSDFDDNNSNNNFFHG